jgi:hypothetical protein
MAHRTSNFDKIETLKLDEDQFDAV